MSDTERERFEAWLDEPIAMATVGDEEQPILRRHAFKERDLKVARSAWQAALSQRQPPADAPVAWGLFALVSAGWVLQHPVRFTEAEAEADKGMYPREQALEVRPLYAPPHPDNKQESP